MRNNCGADRIKKNGCHISAVTRVNILPDNHEKKLFLADILYAQVHSAKQKGFTFGHRTVNSFWIYDYY